MEKPLPPAKTAKQLEKDRELSTSIEFSLPSTGPVTLDVFDLAGRRVAHLLEETRVAGRYVVPWSVNGEHSGLYLYRLRAAGRTLVRKLVVTE